MNERRLQMKTSTAIFDRLNYFKCLFFSFLPQLEYYEVSKGYSDGHQEEN